MESHHDQLLAVNEKKTNQVDNNITIDELRILLHAMYRFYSKARIKFNLVTDKKLNDPTNASVTKAKLIDYMQEVFAMDISTINYFDSEHTEDVIINIRKKFDLFILLASLLYKTAINSELSTETKLAVISRYVKINFLMFKKIIQDEENVFFRKMSVEMYSAFELIDKRFNKSSFPWAPIYNACFVVDKAQGIIGIKPVKYIQEISEKVQAVKNLLKGNKQLRDKEAEKNEIENILSNAAEAIKLAEVEAKQLLFTAKLRMGILATKSKLEEEFEGTTLISTGFLKSLHPQIVKINADISHAENLIEKYTKNAKEKTEVIKEYNIQKNKRIDTEVKKLYKSVKARFNLFDEAFADRLTTSEYKNSIHNWDQKLTAIKENIKQLEWPLTCPKEIDSKKSLGFKVVTDNHSIKQLTIDLNQILQDINKFEDKIRVRMEQAIAANKKAKEENQQQNQKQIGDYKSKVEEDRKKREEEKKKHNQEIRAANRKAQPETIKLLNVEMEKKLTALNKTNLHTLRCILELRHGEVLFEDVERLVEALGGEVIKRKGSHVTIKLEQYMVMFVQETKAKQLVEGQLTAPVSTGGFFNPHGASHSPGEITNFNLSMVKDVFDNAGINLDKVDELEARRNLTPQ